MSDCYGDARGGIMQKKRSSVGVCCEICLTRCLTIRSTRPRRPDKRATSNSIMLTKFKEGLRYV